ncbi:MAG: hypothetical protein Q7T70_13675 [Polaromonas sp.]|nr:hypothetical protein [Polaromonas sp.]
MNKQDKDPAKAKSGPPSERKTDREKPTSAKANAASASSGAQEKATGDKEAKAQGWPFAPGSQLGQQVAKPWTPKPVYRFNQR